MRIGYFADGPWSHLAIKKLLEDNTLQIVFICARYDNPDLILKGIAQNVNIPFLTHPKINSDEFLNVLDVFECDIFISMSFNQIFKKNIIQFCSKGIINCHAGKLPFYRGRNVLNWVLINNESEFGVTVHFVDEGIDTGDIILQQVYPITDEDNYCTLLTRAYKSCSELLYEAIKQIQDGVNDRIPQSSLDPLGFYCTGRKLGDEALNWDQTSREIFNFVRAISKPGPQARTILNKSEILINKVEFLAEAPIYKGIPGAILNIEKDGFLVKTKDSFVKVREWTREVKVKVGDCLQ
jgi:methionyl-tRNA formyltransferase